jgi:signal transduction histidine kinase
MEGPIMTDTTIVRRTAKGPTDMLLRMALTFVLAAVLALVAVPWAGARQTRPVYMELTDLVAPARGLVTEINASLALEGSLLRGEVTSRDPALTGRYRAAYARELAATAEVAGLVGPLGTGATTALAAFRREQRQWHDRIERFLADPSTSAERDQLRGRDYEKVLEAVVRFDAELEAAGQRRRAEILRLELLQSRIAIGLGMLAVAAVAVVGWLARRVRVYATALQERSVALERAIESRERLMRGITHDLKNPLHTIDGHAQLLEEGIVGPLQPSQHDSIRRVRRSVTNMLGLIDDLLDLARTESGQLRITPHPVDVRRVVQDTVEQYRPMAQASGHAIESPEPEGALPAITDAARLRQILGNLLSNAIKYAPHGGRIAVRAGFRGAQAIRQQGRWIAIEVSDSGEGIPPEHQDSVFAEFTRLDAHSDIPGVGLGLSISRRIARLLGGDLTLDSRPKEGATFTLWLPPDRRVTP